MDMMSVSRRLVAVVALPLVASVLVACGTTSPGGASNDAGGVSVAITEPASGASVTAPFTVTLTSGVPLGDENTGLHHVHLYFDDNSSDYLVVRATTVQVTKAPPGAHTMHLSLRNANHSPAGAETEVPLTIAAGGGSSGPGPVPSTTDTYGY